MTTPAAAPAAPAAATPPAASTTPAAPATAPVSATAPTSLIPEDPGTPPASPTAPVVAAAPTDPNSADAWLFAEGVMGTGKAPEFFKKDKYATLSDQAKAYVDLEKRFGSFTGAPKDGKYDVKLPEGIGVELDGEHPLLGDFQKWAAENHLNQGGFTQLLGMLGQYEAQQIVDPAAVKASIGENADARISAVAQWGKANLDADGYAALRSALTPSQHTAPIFKAFEAVIGKTKQVALPKPGADVSAAQPGGLVAIQAEHAKKGADGKRLYDTDPKHRAQVEKAYADHFAIQAA